MNFRWPLNELRQGGISATLEKKSPGLVRCETLEVDLNNRDHHNKYSYQVWWESDKKCALGCVNKVYLWFWACDLLFIP